MFQPQYESDKFGWIDIKSPVELNVAINRAKLASATGFPVRVVELDDQTEEFIRVVPQEEIWGLR